MKSNLRDDLERFGGMAFVRAADCTEVIRRFHGLKNSPKSRVQSPKSRGRNPKPGPEGHPDYPLLREIYRWVFVPLSVWPVDMRGLCARMLDSVASGQRSEERR